MVVKLMASRTLFPQPVWSKVYLSLDERNPEDGGRDFESAPNFTRSEESSASEWESEDESFQELDVSAGDSSDDSGHFLCGKFEGDVAEAEELFPGRVVVGSVRYCISPFLPCVSTIVGVLWLHLDIHGVTAFCSANCG